MNTLGHVSRYHRKSCFRRPSVLIMLMTVLFRPKHGHCPFSISRPLIDQSHLQVTARCITVHSRASIGVQISRPGGPLNTTTSGPVTVISSRAGCVCHPHYSPRPSLAWQRVAAPGGGGGQGYYIQSCSFCLSPDISP